MASIKELKHILKPGSKLLVTKDRANKSNIGKEFSIIDINHVNGFTFGILKELPERSIVIGSFKWKGASFEDGYLYQFDSDENVEKGFKLL